jgi:sulfatase maturation enzyme AslB (radical SAM superfamily)
MQNTAKPRGLKKIWREVKRPVRQLYQHQEHLYHYVRRKLLGLSREQYVANENYLSLAKERDKVYSSAFYIRDDGRVHFPQCETDIVLGCNLRCRSCNHLSPYRKGFVPTEKLVHWFETWRQKIHVDRFLLIGGEPFLHPDLGGVALESRRVWNDSTIEIISNGLLIPQASQNVFDALKKARIRVIISEHSDAPPTREKIAAARNCLKENGIPHTVWAVNSIWLASHQVNKEGIPMPFQSSPDNAYKACVQKRCPALINNRLYKCVQLASIIEGVSEGALSPALWEKALTYNALSSDADANEISKHFRSSVIKECSVCPGKRTLIEPGQMSSLPQSN